MIIPGAHRIELATGGLGFAVRDARRPDIGPVRPGYLYVPGSSVLVPQPPIFDSVTAADGYLTVDVHSPGSVDFYEIGVSLTILPPTAWWSTTNGHLVQPLATGTYYLFARASYQGAYSTWTQYGKLAPGDDEWRLTWSDDSVAGGDHTAYPYTSVLYGHASGWQYATSGGDRIHQDTAYVDAYGLSALSGPTGGAQGIRFDCVLNVGFYAAAKAGVAWGYDPAVMAAAPTTTPYYGLALCQISGGDWHLGLYCVTDQTATELGTVDVTAILSTRGSGADLMRYLAVSVQARGNEVTVYGAGSLVLTVTATGITWSSALTGAGLWYQGSSNPGYSTTAYMDSGVEDYLRVYARDHTGEAETVDPGSADHNDLDGRSEAACHPASAIANTPAGNIAATTVQAAIDELDTEKQPQDADLTAIAALTGTGYPKRTADDTWSMSSVVVEKATSQTVNFDNSLTAAQIQALIDAVPRYVPTGVTVTFQFADGTYTPTASLTFRGFFGGGTVIIQGDTSETNATSLHVTQDVTLDFSASSVHGLTIRDNACGVTVQNLHVKVKGTSASSYRAFYLLQNSARTVVRYCYAEAESATYGAGFYVSAQNAYVHTSYVSNCYYGLISAEGATLTSQSNDDYVDAGTSHASPSYGIYATTSIVFASSTQPAGSVGNTGTSGGGQIFS